MNVTLLLFLDDKANIIQKMYKVGPVWGKLMTFHGPSCSQANKLNYVLVVYISSLLFINYTITANLSLLKGTNIRSNTPTPNNNENYW